MKYQAIFFDLDGTLLPMDNDAFTKGYFQLLAQTAAPLGYAPQTLIPAMWKGVSDMVKNDGTRPNHQVFWATFAEIFGPQVYDHIPVFDRFYDTDFHKAASFAGTNPKAGQAVELARSKAGRVVLATNPLFPPAGVRTRLGWLGLSFDDFNLVTHYENSSTCKPNPNYYREIMDKLGLRPEQCLMVGNDAQEDVEAACAAGLDAFLVTDCLISRGEMPECPQGDFDALLAFLKAL